MLARATDTLPEGPHWRYEPKWDGFRAIAEINGRVAISSRSGARLDRKFPEIADALAAIPGGATLDGEIVRWGGRLDFDALLRRNRASARTAPGLARAEPCHFIVFDLLRHNGRDLTRRPLDQRRAALADLLDGIDDPTLMLSWQTPDVDEAMDWWSGLADVGVEGLVAKDGRSRYRPGNRGWLKYKRRTTTDAIIGGIIGKTHSPRTLILGRYDPDGRLRIAGRTTDLTRAQQEAIANAGLQKAAAGHPWPATLAPRWGSRDRIAYTRVEPTIVVEVEPDTATTGHTWRHAVRYRRPRPDLTPTDVPTGLDTA
ncbi:ATP-dependent DNA ligase [Streptomonospora wellingtoniae]|uniref:ATP-dependent DNA ligase n=1 Tax=Streptomonospora wellingtoniae TaxID=3075544 RepID=A0ABU2KUA8_9ACTN|nr:ATP-dependent DNA ligase [Streptomonospora sp. DSM 45055]MDT0302885.1 ATP-dependent DNA ligase [Streptomonospora sp. DSM 45055]